ncbi:MAG: PilW family protein [Candidatus Rifleibacteriota bacterium]
MMKKTKTGMTMVELIFVVGMVLLLSGSVFQLLRSITKNFRHSQNKLDILQTTRIIMTGVRNELRNAAEKPQVFNGRLNIPLSTETVQYYFNEETRRLFRGKKESLNAPDPDVEDMRPFLFDDGQILAFEYDSSYRDSNAFVQSELALNSKVWFKVSMKILYTEKFDRLSDEDKEKILEDPDSDPRVKSFFMMITPRKVNWLLQATQ